MIFIALKRQYALCSHAERDTKKPYWRNTFKGAKVRRHYRKKILDKNENKLYEWMFCLIALEEAALFWQSLCVRAERKENRMRFFRM
jgi:hypothetical protein